MKKSRLITIILLLICITTITSTKAKDESYLDLYEEFTGTIKFGEEVENPGYGPNAVYNGRVLSYYYHDISFTADSGFKGKAFCVFPNLNARNESKVSCGIPDPNYFPITYYVVYNYWDELKNNKYLADYVMRTAGIFDKDRQIPEKAYDLCYDECIKQGKSSGECVSIAEACGNSTKGWQAVTGEQATMEAAFIVTYHHNIKGDPFAEGQGEDLLFVGKDPNGVQVIERGNQILKEAQAAKDLGKDGPRGWQVPSNSEVGTGTAQGTITGKNFTVTPIENMTRETKVGFYSVSTVDGQNVGNITITPIKGTYVWVSEWNGSSGIIKVTADAECKAEIKITIGGSGSSATPSQPRPSCQKLCQKTVPDTREVCPSGHSHYNCTAGYNDKGQCRGGYTSCDVPKVPVPYDRVVASHCVNRNESCPNGFRTVSSNNDTKYSIESGYATEKSDLSLDGYIANGMSEEYTEDYIETFMTPEDRPDISIYYCSINGERSQSYIVVTDNSTKDDVFPLKIDCDNCYVGDCEPALRANDTAEVKVHNCCDGATSIVRQAALDELFCTDFRSANGVLDYSNSIHGYKPKCNVKESDYKTDKLDSNPYCTMYCSDTIMYDIPGPTHAKAGEYFEFTKTGDGFNGPKYDHYRRCRTTIAYDVWNQDYDKQVNCIINKYNEYQKAEAYHQLLIGAKNASAEQTIDSTTQCSRTITYTDRCNDPYVYRYKCVSHSSGSISYSTTGCGDGYEEYPEYEDSWSDCDKYAPVTGDEKTVDEAKITYYNEKNQRSAYKYASFKYNSYYKPEVAQTGLMIPDAELSGKTYSEASVKAYMDAYDEVKKDAKKSVDDKVDEWKENDDRFKSVSDYNCGTDPSYTPAYNIDTKIGTADTNAKRVMGEYASLVQVLNGLQSKLNECGGIYSSEGINADSIKKRVGFTADDEPQLQFSYTQIYLNEKQKIDKQEIKVPFDKVDSNGNVINKCVINTYSSLTDPVQTWPRWDITGWEQDNYYTRDNPPTIHIGNYKQLISYIQNNYSEFTGSETDYYANRKYTTDGVGHMSCRWMDSKDNVQYTLIPVGLITTKDPVQEGKLKDLGGKWSSRTGTYKINKSAARGKYEVYYTMKNVGGQKSKNSKEGKFDKLIHSEGKTCSGMSDIVNYEGTPVNATCYIEINNESQSMYDCTGQTIGLKTDPTCKESMTIKLDYKEVDPKDPFPNIDSYNPKTTNGYKNGYAYNWMVDENGKKAYEHITEYAKKDKTYSTEELTYSFTLKPKDLKAIREYNAKRLKDGGYTDFNMECDDENNSEGKPLTNCRSKFLEAISDWKAVDGLRLKTNNMDLDKLRKRLKDK